MSEDELVSLEQFLEDKTDYSRFLVHLTRSDELVSAKEVLTQILDTRTLKAYKPWCIVQYDFNTDEDPLRDKFKVICFTETPLEQIKSLLKPLTGRPNTPEAYGLVFTKDYIRLMDGNPVFYLTRKLAKPLRDMFLKYKHQLTPDMHKLLALTTLCEHGNDWHWEREWRIAGNLVFKYDSLYCGICPEEDITYFQKRFKPVKFIDPRWGIKRLVYEVVKKEPPAFLVDDLPF